jgi:hypothetical protein
VRARILRHASPCLSSSAALWDLSDLPLFRNLSLRTIRFSDLLARIPPLSHLLPRARRRTEALLMTWRAYAAEPPCLIELFTLPACTTFRNTGITVRRQTRDRGNRLPSRRLQSPVDHHRRNCTYSRACRNRRRRARTRLGFTTCVTATPWGFYRRASPRRSHGSAWAAPS